MGQCDSSAVSQCCHAIISVPVTFVTAGSRAFHLSSFDSEADDPSLTTLAPHISTLSPHKPLVCVCLLWCIIYP